MEPVFYIQFSRPWFCNSARNQAILFFFLRTLVSERLPLFALDPMKDRTVSMLNRSVEF